MNQKNYSYYLNCYRGKSFLEFLYKTAPNAIVAAKLDKGFLSLISFNKKVFFLATLLMKHFQFNYFIDATAIDFPEKFSRFEVFYIFRKIIVSFVSKNFFLVKSYEPGQSISIFLQTQISELEPLTSLERLFPACNWAEREIWDLYGIFFINHPDLRRLLTDYGFQGHPFRKDFPLTGYIEIRYDTSKQRIVYEPVQLAQEFRLFDFVSPWVQVEN